MGLIKNSVNLMIAAVLVGGAAIPVTQTVLVTELQTVDNETHASSGSVPDVFTADNVEYGLVKDSETLVLNDSFDSTTYTLDSSEYKVNYESGEFNVTEADLDGDGNAEINSSSDTYKVDYKYKPNGYVGGLSAVILPFVIVGLAAALLMASFKPFLNGGM